MVLSSILSKTSSCSLVVASFFINDKLTLESSSLTRGGAERNSFFNLSFFVFFASQKPKIKEMIVGFLPGQ